MVLIHLAGTVYTINAVTVYDTLKVDNGRPALSNNTNLAAAWINIAADFSFQEVQISGAGVLNLPNVSPPSPRNTNIRNSNIEIIFFLICTDDHY